MSARHPRRRPRGILTGCAALIVGMLLLCHGMFPELGGATALLESLLPWLGIALIALGLLALLRLSLFAGLAVAAAMAVWWSAFGVAMLPAMSGGTPRFTVASENIQAGNTSAAQIAADLARRSPDLIAIQELDADSRPAIESELTGRYPHHAIVGTVGVWSRYELSEVEGLSLGLGWDRALSVNVATPGVPTRVYTVHLASVRPGEYAERDTMLEELHRTIAADESEHLLVVGDFNAASTDRALSPLLDSLSERPDSEFGLGFTWPAAFPVARLDHVLVRGLNISDSTVLPDNGSDHRGVLVGLR